MEWITVNEAAKIWVIPKGTPKPLDGRAKASKQRCQMK